MHAAIIISADAEWQAALPLFPDAQVRPSPAGDWFERVLPAPPAATTDDEASLLSDIGYPVVFLHGGWGKIAAAASAQYVFDRWAPPLLINLGTCGGFRGRVERGEIILAEQTIVYDLGEQMTDPAEALAHYTTRIDLAWLTGALPHPVRRGLLISADRDLVASDVPDLQERFGATAADWESGAIAWVAARNAARCLILRGVSDLVGPGGGEAYDGNGQFFAQAAAPIIRQLVENLPAWLLLSDPRP